MVRLSGVSPALSQNSSAMACSSGQCASSRFNAAALQHADSYASNTMLSAKYAAQHNDCGLFSIPILGTLLHGAATVVGGCGCCAGGCLTGLLGLVTGIIRF